MPLFLTHPAMPAFSVQRSVVIEKPVSEVFPKVAHYQHMNQWSPWLVMERSATTESRGTEGEVGAIHYWNGNLTGEGEMELTRVEANQTIEADLRFLAPWKSQATTQFNFAEDGDRTTVTWTMHGSLPFFMFWMKSTMEALVGMDYDRGLRMLKEYCETGQVLTDVQVKGEQQGHSFHYLGVKNSCPIAEVGPTMAADFEKLEAYIKQHQPAFQNPAFSIYQQFDLKKGVCTYTSGVATPELMAAPEGFVTGTVQGGKAFAIEHTGPYTNLGNAWSTGYSYVYNKKIKLRKGADPLEIYTNHPKMTDPKDLHTVIYFPVK